MLQAPWSPRPPTPPRAPQASSSPPASPPAPTGPAAGRRTHPRTCTRHRRLSSSARLTPWRARRIPGSQTWSSPFSARRMQRSSAALTACFRATSAPWSTFRSRSSPRKTAGASEPRPEAAHARGLSSSRGSASVSGLATPSRRQSTISAPHPHLQASCPSCSVRAGPAFCSTRPWATDLKATSSERAPPPSRAGSACASHPPASRSSTTARSD